MTGLNLPEHSLKTILKANPPETSKIITVCRYCREKKMEFPSTKNPTQFLLYRWKHLVIKAELTLDSMLYTKVVLTKQ